MSSSLRLAAVANTGRHIFHTNQLRKDARSAALHRKEKQLTIASNILGKELTNIPSIKSDIYVNNSHHSYFSISVRVI